MAIYGRDYYGRAKYGGRQRAEMAVDPFEATVIGFDAISLSWSEPGGGWGGFRLVRNRSGFPIFETDGDVVLDFPPGYVGSTGQQFLDTNRTGGWTYYAIFLWDTGAAVWERAAAVDVLVPYDFDGTARMWDTIPEWYLQIRDEGAGYSQQSYRINPAIYLNNEQSVPNLTLAKFIHLFGWSFDTLRTQAEYIRDGYDVNQVHVNRLALLAAQFGSEIEESAPASVNRSLVRNLGWLYRKRGTLDGIREMISMATGWEVDVTIGRNLMLSEDQANFTHPDPQDWDATVKYRPGDRVRYMRFLFQAITAAYGADQAPSSTHSDNTWWNQTAFVEPVSDTTVSRTDTGDISTWQIEGPTGFVSGMTNIGVGTVDPEDGTIFYSNALAFRNNTATASADFSLRSIPRHKDNLTSWSKRLIYESGVPVPSPRFSYVAGKRYRAGDLVMYQGAPYEAQTSTTLSPTYTDVWKKLGNDDRTRLSLSFYAHGPFSGTVGAGGKRIHAIITEFDEYGNLIADTVCNPASFANIYFDTFNDIGTVTNGRLPAKGAAWSANGVGTWGTARDSDGGYAFPPATGRSYQLAPATLADANVAITYRAVPAAVRLLGVIFRWVDANNFWIATQTGVYKVVAGAARANPATGALTYTTFQAGDRMQVQLSGSTIKVYKNGVLLGTATDAFNSTATRHGVEVEA